MNIVSIISSLLTPAVVARIASALGINPTIAQMAISAALPAILAGLAGKAAQPSSLGVLSGLLGQQNPGMLGHASVFKLTGVSGTILVIVGLGLRPSSGCRRANPSG